MDTAHISWCDFVDEKFLRASYDEKVETVNVSEFSETTSESITKKHTITDLISTASNIESCFHIFWLPYDHHKHTIKVKKELLYALNQELGLDLAFRYGTDTTLGLTVMPSTRKNSSQPANVACSVQSFLGVYWSYDLVKEQTVSVCWTEPDLQHDMRVLLHQYKAYLKHPMLPAVLIAVLTEQWIWTRYLHASTIVMEVARRTKNHNGAYGSEVTAASGKLSALSTRMSACAMEVGDAIHICLAQRALLCSISEYGYGPSGQKFGCSLEINGITDVLKERNEAVKIKLERVERQVQIQLTAVSMPMIS